MGVINKRTIKIKNPIKINRKVYNKETINPITVHISGCAGLAQERQR